jgi:hypothetical protein
MNNPNPENPPVTPPVQQPDNRRRLRELLSIPERDRTDEQWDEIIELEIQLAPGNRISGNDHGPVNTSGHQHGKPGGGGQQKKHRPRTGPGGGPGGGNNNNNRRPRQNKPSGGGGGNSGGNAGGGQAA